MIIETTTSVDQSRSRPAFYHGVTAHQVGDNTRPGIVLSVRALP